MKLKCNCLKEKEGYSEKYDACFCMNCNKWLESKCGGENCEFCKDRPNKFASENNQEREKEVKDAN